MSFEDIGISLSNSLQFWRNIASCKDLSYLIFGTSLIRGRKKLIKEVFGSLCTKTNPFPAQSFRILPNL
jgi:hypothetical protein